MVRRNKMFLLFALVGATLVGCGSVNSLPLIESATDLLSNEKGIRFAADGESFVGSDEVVAYSPTYAQYGTNPATGNKVLRFATAVKGAITSISYTRAPVEGETNAHVKEVYSLYSGIMANGETQYYTSTGLSQSEEDRYQYYWACYSIEYRDTARYGLDVDVTFSVNGEVVNTKQANLQNMIDVETKLYKSIYIDGDVRVQHGQNINTAEFVVKAINHDGTEEILEPSDYSIVSSKIARFGESATLEIVHNQDSSLTATKEVVTTRRVEAESGTIVGGKTVSEPEYTLVDGTLVEGATIDGVGGFSAAIKGGLEGSLTLTYVSRTAHTGGLTMKISNSNLAGPKDVGPFYMKDLQLNSIVDISVNGTNISIADDVIVEGTPDGFTSSGYKELYGLYQNISFDNIAFNVGANTLKFNFKRSTLGEINTWNESPSEFNIDYVDFYSTGSMVDEIDVEAGLTLDESTFTIPTYGTEISKVKETTVVALGRTKSGNKVAFEGDELNVTITGGDHSYMEGTEDYIVFGEHTITFKLLENEEIFGTYTFNVREEDNEYIGLTRIQEAFLRQTGDKVYYVIKGTSRAVKPGDAVLFDGDTIFPSEWTFGLNTYECSVDVTDKGAGYTIWPHIKVKGNNWDNNKGDVVIYGDAAKAYSIEFGGRKYSLAYQYNMPVLTIS